MSQTIIAIETSSAGRLVGLAISIASFWSGNATKLSVDGGNTWPKLLGDMRKL
jgi:hypothetical protein